MIWLPLSPSLFPYTTLFRSHPEDYPKYIEGGDVISFDIYPAVHDKPEIAGNLWYVARGVERLVQWSGGKKIVWNCLECTRIDRKSTRLNSSHLGISYAVFCL